MYKLMVIVSILIRQLYIPNPFEPLGNRIIVHISEIPLLNLSEILNVTVEPLIYVVTFTVVGLYYKKGSAPTRGSFLYLLFYCVHIFLLWLISLLGFATWAVALILVLYVGVHAILIRLRCRCF